jgi:hypothetical protein
VPREPDPYVELRTTSTVQEHIVTLIATHAAAPPVGTHATVVEPVVALKRRTIDSVFIGAGAVAVAVLVVAGGMLTWGANFSKDYVHDELTSQHVAFPPAADLKTEGRTDLLPFAGHTVDSGAEAQAYASFINGHLQAIAGGATYADLGGPEREAIAAVDAATTAGSSPAQVAALQAKADALTGQRNTMFKGETLRGLLLTAFAWGTVGRIAGIAAFAAFAAAGAMLVLVAFGFRHHHKVVAQVS